MMLRFPLPDLLKGFAVFLIIPVHILEKFIDYQGRESLFGKTLMLLGGPVAVPVFMMVMGYFLARSKKSTKQNILRGVLIFLLGIFLNIGLNFHLLLKIIFEGWRFNPLQSIFAVDIFYLAGLSIIFLSVLKTIKNRQHWIIFGLIVFVSATTFYFNEILVTTNRNYILPFIGGQYSWSYFPLFPWLVYPLIGFLFQRRELDLLAFFQKQKAVSIIFLTTVFLLVAFFARYGVETTINLDTYYHHTFTFFLWVLGVDILWILLLWFIVRKYTNFPPIVFLQWLGRNITIFYVVQWLIIGNIATAIYQTQELLSFAYWFPVILLITMALTFLREKISVRHFKI